MNKYLITCIGTNKIIEDSFGPRVGKILLSRFSKNSNIKIYGTMKEPVHFKNIKYVLNEINKKYEEYNKIVIDSAYSKKENIGRIFIGLGGIEIGKAYGKGIYIPADLNIKTVVMNYNYLDINNYKNKNINISKIIEELSFITANKIIEIIK